MPLKGGVPHCIHKDGTQGFWAAFQVFMLFMKQKRCEAPRFSCFFLPVFCFLRIFVVVVGVCLSMASVREQMHNTNVSLQKENLVLGKIGIGGSWQLFKRVYCL